MLSYAKWLLASESETETPVTVKPEALSSFKYLKATNYTESPTNIFVMNIKSVVRIEVIPVSQSNVECVKSIYCSNYTERTHILDIKSVMEM